MSPRKRPTEPVETDEGAERQKELRRERREWIFPIILVVALVGGITFALLRPDQPGTADGEGSTWTSSSHESEYEDDADYEDNAEYESDPVYEDDAAATSTGSSPVSSDGGFRDTGGDTSVIDALAAAGVTEDAALGVAEAGDANGFILDTRSPTYEESMDFAYMSALECQSVANGETTWSQVRSESISTGASPSEADSMTSYWEGTFCPGLDLDAF